MDALEDCGGPWGLMELAEGYRKIIAGKELSDEEKEQMEWAEGSSKISVDKARKRLAGPTPEDVSVRIREEAGNFDETSIFRRG